MRKRLLLLSLFVIAALQWQGCDSRGTPTEPELVDPFMEIVDGTHVLGNQNFFFLPPLVPDPSRHPSFDAEAFDPSLSPVVEICQTDGEQCLDPQDQTNGFPLRSGVELPYVTLSLEEEHYQVNWHTHLFVLDDESLYRIRVFVDDFELGYADVDVVRSGRELKNVNTGQSIALLRGRTLPIKFRIQMGAVPEPPPLVFSYDGTGKVFGPRPLIPAAFTSADGSDIYPVGAEAFYIFTLFDTGSDIVYVGPSDAATLGIGPASSTNPNQDTRIRVNGLSAIDPTTLLAPIGPHGGTGGAQAEVTDVRVGPREGPWDLTLIGTPVANEVVARIDNATTVSRGPYAFCGGCYAEGPDITFYMPTDAGIAVPALQLPLERFGSGAPALLDGATNGQKYFMNGVTFSNGTNAVADDPAGVEPIRFWFDTGAQPTMINTRVANALGLDLVAGGSFDCWSTPAEPGLEGYVIDRVAFVGSGPSGPGTYEVTNAAVCVDVADTRIRQRYPEPGGGSRLMDATIGANLFVHVPILFHGKDSWLGILIP